MQPNIYQPPIMPPMIAVDDSIPLGVFGSDIEGTRVAQRYIPSHFPNLPGQHSYKDSEILTGCESDARRVRELATKEGMQAEQALRRLMIARQDGSRTKKLLGQRDFQTESEAQADDFFKSAMAAASAVEGGSQPLGLAPTDVDFGAVVNHEKAFWRKWAVVN